MFLDELDVRARPGERWELLTPLRWQSSPTDAVTVPAAFITDLASIPRWFQWAPHFGVNGRSRRAAVLHDYLYSKVQPIGYPLMGSVTKSAADKLFRQALAAEGLNRGTCTLYYYAVHWFGRPKPKRVPTSPLRASR